VIERNAEEGVTWVGSFVSEDTTRSFCVYQPPDPGSDRKSAARNELPVDQITRVRVLYPTPSLRITRIRQTRRGHPVQNQQAHDRADA